MADVRTRFNVRLSTELKVSSFKKKTRVAVCHKLKLVGFVPFSLEDFGVDGVTCSVTIVSDRVPLSDGDLPLSADDPDYLLIAQKDQGSFYEKHRVDAVIGRLLIRGSLRPEIDQRYGELGSPIELWLPLSDEEIQQILAGIAAFGTASNVSVQFDVECEVFHEDCSGTALDTRRLVIAEDEEYPVVALNISVGRATQSKA